MAKSKENRVVLIAGPTASGKSAIALQLAQSRDAVIINADSMQVYRELRVLTARPSAEDEALAEHRLYGHVSGAEDYSVARWLAEAKREIASAHERGKQVIICGGTGLYFMALERGIAEVPPIPDDIRQKWREFGGDLHGELVRIDPESAQKLNPSDRQRLVRALEVKDATGLGLPEWQRRAAAHSILKGLDVRRSYQIAPREELYRNADRRFDLMLQQGAMDEVKALPQLPPKQPLMKAIGVRELQAYLSGETTLDIAKSAAQTATRNFIKRQLTWWRGQMKEWQPKN